METLLNKRNITAPLTSVYSTVVFGSCSQDKQPEPQRNMYTVSQEKTPTFEQVGGSMRQDLRQTVLFRCNQ